MKDMDELDQIWRAMARLERQRRRARQRALVYGTALVVIGLAGLASIIAEMLR